MGKAVVRTSMVSILRAGCEIRQYERYWASGLAVQGSGHEEDSVLKQQALSNILIEQIQLPRSGPARPGNFREATGFPPISIFPPLQFYYSL